MLVSGCEAIGVSEKALSGLVLHFGEGGAGTRPCEAAWLGNSEMKNVCSPPIRVFVSRSSLLTMRRAYAPLGASVTVEPLLFSEKELDVEAILSMMAVGSSDSAPLYMQRVMVSAIAHESVSSIDVSILTVVRSPRRFCATSEKTSPSDVSCRRSMRQWTISIPSSRLRSSNAWYF